MTAFPRCHLLSQVLFGAFPAFVSSETLLLFFRVRAVFLDSPSVIRFFLVSFLGVTIFSAFIPLSLSGGNIPGTDYCTITHLNRPLATALLVVPLANHITVFLAVSYRLLESFDINGRAENTRIWYSRTPKFCRVPRGFPLLTRTVVNDGQIYILYVFDVVVIP